MRNLPNVLTPNFRTPLSIRMFDLDVQRFINVSGISEGIEREAVNNFTLNLKTGLVNGTNAWINISHIYPMLGTTDQSRGTDLVMANDQMTFHGGYVHNALGTYFDGVSGYADSRMKSWSDLGSSRFAPMLYLRDNVQSDGVAFGIGHTGAGQRTEYKPRTTADLMSLYAYDAARSATAANIDSSGLTTAMRRSSPAGFTFWKGDTSIGTASQGLWGYNGSNGTGYLMAFNNRTTGVADQFYENEARLFMFGNGWQTQNEMEDINAAVNVMMLDLGRNV